MTDKPFFRFHPDAYEHGVFEESDEVCGACGKPCVWKYAENIYTPDPVPIVCARCIASGDAAKAMVDGEYGLHDFTFDEDPSDDLIAEIDQRTPGFSTFNPFVWPVRDGMPLAFLGFGEDKALAGKPAVMAAIAALAADMGAEVGPSYALIFKALDSDVYVATLDLD